MGFFLFISAYYGRHRKAALVLTRHDRANMLRAVHEGQDVPGILQNAKSILESGSSSDFVRTTSCNSPRKSPAPASRAVARA
jgi:hypothetical protein